MNESKHTRWIKSPGMCLDAFNYRGQGEIKKWDFEFTCRFFEGNSQETVDSDIMLVTLEHSPGGCNPVLANLQLLFQRISGFHY